MSDSKKLPTIEVGDTVVFRNDLVVFQCYGCSIFEPNMVKSTKKPQIVRVARVNEFSIHNDKHMFYFTPQMVAEVIKPTKERTYSEEEMKQCWEQAFNQGMNLSDEDYEVVLFKEFIQSLNK
jgi:hypothetical protein